MLLEIIVPQDNHVTEREYILEVIFGLFLNLSYKIKFTQRKTPYIRIKAAHKEFLIANTFFNLCNEKGWLTKETLPITPLQKIPPGFFLSYHIKDSLPVLFGKKSFTISDDKIVSELDILGSSFFMLSRYEEAIVQERDNFNRFPAKASIAYKEAFLNKPIVNEYLEVLWTGINYLWPELKRKTRTFRTIVSCDVDTPFDLAYKSFFATSKRITADIVKRQNFIKATQTLKNYFSIKKLGKQEDPYFKNIYYIASFLESQNLYGAFYFICGNTAGLIDGDYDITTDKNLHQLLQDLNARGHELGLHGSFNTYRSAEQLTLEFHTFNQILNKLDIKVDQIGGRQHYLRWKTPETAAIYSQVGLTYDTTLSYAEHSGFRCGICYEFPLFDLNNRKKLNLIERPLIAMEGSVIQRKYMGLGYGSRALNYLKGLKEECRTYNGDFTFLWHNSYLNLKEDFKLFERTILA